MHGAATSWGTWATVGLSLTAAVFLGTGFVLQQRAASSAPIEDMLRPRLVAYLVRRPQWLAGIACMVVGQLLSAAALGASSITLVEPLLSVNLLVALLLAGLLSRQRLCRRDWTGAFVLCAALAAFVAAADPEVGEGPEGAGRLAVTVGAIAGLALLLVAISRRRPLTEQATLLAGAAGCLAGLQDGFTRTAVLRLEEAPGALVRLWQAYAVVGIALVVILLAQSAFEAGPLRRSLPALVAGEPLTGIAFGVVVFGDRLRTGPLALAFEVAGLVGIVVGVYLLASSLLLSQALEEPGAHAGEGRA